MSRRRVPSSAFVIPVYRGSETDESAVPLTYLRRPELDARASKMSQGPAARRAQRALKLTNFSAVLLNMQNPNPDPKSIEAHSAISSALP